MALSEEEIKKQRLAMKDAGFKGKVAYFWEYYKVHTLVIAFCIIFFGALIHDIVTSKDYGFYAIMVNCYQTVEQEQIESEFASLASINEEKYDVLIDLTTAVNMDSLDQYTIANSEKIMAVTASGDLDIITSDADTFNYYARSSMFYDLRDIMTKEQLQKYADYIYYIDQAVIDAVNDGTYELEEASDVSASASTDDMDAIMENGNEMSLSTFTASEYVTPEDFTAPDPTKMESPIPVGIICTDAPYLAELGIYTDRVPVIGVIASSERIDLALQYIDYLWDGVTE
ncbi:MAG: hypothetical protein K6A23_01795 [Butyrivibrio sp.]|nr:hypothetical protein [Butyrivibrio sp.]